MSDEVATLRTIVAHRAFVSSYLNRFADAMNVRALEHDLSKLLVEEFDGFVSINKIAREHPYGSEEYRAALKDNAVIDLHFFRNRHHPEFHDAQVAGMGLLDIIEMVCDWKAAGEVYGMTSFRDALQIQVERFGLTERQVWLINMIAEAVD